MISLTLIISSCTFNSTITCLNTLAFSSQLFFLFKRRMKMEQSDPKRRNIKFRRRGIAQNKEYNMYSVVYLNDNFAFTCYNFIHYYYYYYYYHHHHHHHHHLILEEY